MYVLTRRINWYAAWPVPVRSWPWPEVNLSPWPYEVVLFIIRRVLLREMQWCLNYCSFFICPEAIVEKTILAKNSHFDIWLLEATRLTWGQIWQIIPDGVVDWLIGIAFFGAPLALLVDELHRLAWKVLEIVINRKKLTFDDLWWHDLWPVIKFTISIIFHSRRCSSWTRWARGARKKTIDGQ